MARWNKNDLYFYVYSEACHGPVSVFEILLLLESGELKSHDFIRP